MGKVLQFDVGRIQQPSHDGAHQQCFDRRRRGRYVAMWAPVGIAVLPAQRCNDVVFDAFVYRRKTSVDRIVVTQPFGAQQDDEGDAMQAWIPNDARQASAERLAQIGRRGALLQ